MGRQRGPSVPRWRQLLRAGCWWLLSLSGTALRGLRWLWRLAWVGTTGPLPRGPSCTCVGSKRGACPQPGAGAWGGGAAGAPALYRWCWALWFGVAGAAVVGVTMPSDSMAGGSGPSSLGVGSWLKALYGSAHQEPWGRGDVALGSARPGAGLNLLLSPRGHRPLPQYLLICYKSCWDGAFQVTEEVTPQCAPMLWGLWRSPTPWDTAEPGDMVCWVALWHQRGCRSPGHGTAGFPSQSRCRGPAGLSCPWTCQSPLSVAAFSSAQHCG